MKRLYLLITIQLILANNIANGQVPSAGNKIITKKDIEKVGTSIPASAIGEPVGSVKLYPPRWIEATEVTPEYAVVEGSILPVDPNGWPINFRVLLPASWSRRAIQSGGGGMNGSITVRAGRNPMINKGFVMYGSDSGHQGGMGGEALASSPAGARPDAWALNEEAIRNLGYMQMKKTHDAAMVIIERIYNERPRFNYYVGGSQGGREGLMVAQRYPADYNGIISDVPIVSFSTLMLAPELIRIQEKPLANWVTPALTDVIRAEFLRQCDKLDGLSDGIINNYQASRAIFDVTDGSGPDDPWKALREPEVGSGLTGEQIKTLEFVYSRLKFPYSLANGVKSFGMWLPTTDPASFGTITPLRYKGQEGADEKAQVHSSLGILGVTGFLMQDLSANPLDYAEGKAMIERRVQISEWLDATNPDLNAFYKLGGKIIITVGTQDFIASSGAQLDYYQSLVNKLGWKKLDKFARLYVVPQGGHGLSGRSYKMNGDGEAVEIKNIPAPNSDDKLDMLISWVEENKAPAKTLVVRSDGRIDAKPEGKGYILCSYPNFPRYKGGPEDQVSSYTSSAK